jgi:PAS domain S-box-containing protein
MSDPNQDFGETPFLRGGGETAELIARHDWASTSLGPLTAWSQSLKTGLSIVLRSSLPMAMLCGEDGVTLYNEAFGRLIGPRHPAAMGSKVREAWPDIAGLADQMMKCVLAGETLTFRDLEQKVVRSGQVDRIWMTSQCSPVLDEAGRPVAVLLICMEATPRVLAEHRAAIELDRLRNIFEQAPGFIVLSSGPDHVYEFVNETHNQIFGDRDLVGRPVREVFKDLPDQSFGDMLDRIYATGERVVGRAQRAFLPSRSGEGFEERFLDYVFAPVTDREGRIVGVFGEGFDVTEQVHTQAAAEESQRRLSAAIAIAQLGAFEWDLETGRAILDDRAREIFAFDADNPLMMDDVVARIDAADFARVKAEQAVAEAAGRTRREHEYRIYLPDGSTRHIAAVSDTVHATDGRPVRMIGVFDDVTEKRRAESRQRLLINELNHRVKNTLATVQSIAAQTLRSADDVRRAREAFEARLVALAAAHDLLTAQSWNGARLTDVVATAMAPFETTQRSQVSRSGPPVWLTAPRALALSLALHELATNAAKYGALSIPEGRVTIRWTLSVGELALSWREEGGPPVEPPARSGFGTRLLQRSLAHELRGDVAVTYAPEGVRCEIRFEVEQARSRPGHASAQSVLGESVRGFAV